MPSIACHVAQAADIAPVKTHIDIDAGLLDRALAVGGHGTKKEAVNAALQAYVAHFALCKLLAQRGKVAWEGEIRE